MKECFDESPRSVRRKDATKIGRFTVVRAEIESTDGQTHPYSFLEERPCVCVLPVAGDKIVLIRQYRYPISAWSVELPCGAIEDFEKPETAAERELLEETGYRADRLIPLGACYARGGISNCVVHFFTAECSPAGCRQPDSTEVIETLLVTPEEFGGMIETGRFYQLMGIACWIRAKQKGKVMGYE